MLFCMFKGEEMGRVWGCENYSGTLVYKVSLLWPKTDTDLVSFIARHERNPRQLVVTTENPSSKDLNIQNIIVIPPPIPPRQEHQPRTRPSRPTPPFSADSGSIARAPVGINADDPPIATVGARSVLGGLAVALADGARAADVNAVGACSLAQGARLGPC